MHVCMHICKHEPQEINEHFNDKVAFKDPPTHLYTKHKEIKGLLEK